MTKEQEGVSGEERDKQSEQNSPKRSFGKAMEGAVDSQYPEVIEIN